MPPKEYNYKPQEDFPFVAGILLFVASLLALFSYLHVDMPLSILAIVAHVFLLYTTVKRLYSHKIAYTHVAFLIVIASVFQTVVAHVLGVFHLFISLGALALFYKAEQAGVKLS